jgi:hypothetical protein
VEVIVRCSGADISGDPRSQRFDRRRPQKRVISHRAALLTDLTERAPATPTQAGFASGAVAVVMRSSQPVGRGSSAVPVMVSGASGLELTRFGGHLILA